MREDSRDAIQKIVDFSMYGVLKAALRICRPIQRRNHLSRLRDSQHFPQCPTSGRGAKGVANGDTIGGMKAKPSKTAWRDPVKGHAAKDATMQTKGNFAEFRELMKRVVKIKSPREAKPTSASPGPVASA